MASSRRFFPRLVRRVSIPRHVEDVVTIAHDREVDPIDVGMEIRDVANIWRATVGLYKSRMHPAIALCLRRRGQVVIDRAIGYAKGGGPDEPDAGPKVLATPDTPSIVTTKP